MTADTNATSDNSIRAAAIAKGYADALVVPMHSRERKDSLDAGNWFVLSVKRGADDDWEIRGRRRTEAELIQML